MSIQFIKDTSGADAFVVVPIAEWEALQKRLAGQPIQSFGLTPAEGVETRARLEAFAPDWDAPEMDAYDTIHVKAIQRTIGRVDMLRVGDALRTALNR